MDEPGQSERDGGDPDDETVSGEVLPTTPGADPTGGGALDPSALLGGGLDLGAMLEMASSVQSQVAESQQRLAEAEVTGTSGGGAVRVTLNGHLHLVGLSLEPSAVDPDDLTMTEDLIRAAWRDAHDQVARLQAEADPLGGLGGLGGLLGGG